MNELITLDFENNNQVRTIIQNKETWFVAKDVCKILGLNNVTNSVRKLDEDEKLTLKILRAGQNRELNVVNEFGLYNLILRSNKPEAKQFKRWITHEVLPTIRKFGCYPKPQLEQEHSNEYLRLKEVCGELMVSSKDVAMFFNKNHNTVMSDIINIFNNFRDNKDDFELAYYQDGKYKKVMYYMNKKGFDLVTSKYCKHPVFLKLRYYYFQAFDNYDLLHN